MRAHLARLMNTEPITALKIISVLAFVSLCGLAIATLLVARDESPLEVSGSPTPPEFLPRTVANMFGSGDFVTNAPDGKAYVQISYRSPKAFDKLVHSYIDPTWPQKFRITEAMLQASDDGVSWMSVGEAREKNGEIAFDLRAAGAHRHWKLLAIKSGEAPELVFGELLFQPPRNIIQRLPLDGVWLGLIPASLLLFCAFRTPLSSSRIFAVTAIPVVLFLLSYSFAYAPHHTSYQPDSFSYLQPTLNGTYSSFRNVGYPSIVLALHRTVGLDHLAWVQGTTGALCYAIGAWLLAVRLRNKWLGAILALPVLLQGTVTQYAPVVLTEGFFMAGLGIFAVALGALARRPDKCAVIAASFGIALAILAKSVGAVLILPALLLIRFLPRGRRLSVSGTIVASGLLAFAVLGATSFVRLGSLTERASGFSLVGHVAWMLNDDAMPPTVLTRAMIEAVAPVVEQRPADLGKISSVAALNRYVEVTTGDYNTLLWQKLYPLSQAIGPPEQADAFFLRFAISSIRAHPFLYVRHVVAHFYGLWHYMGFGPPLRRASIAIRNEVAPLAESPARAQIPANVIASYPEKAIIASEASTQAQLPLITRALLSDSKLSTRLTLSIGVIALVFSILFLLPCRLAHFYRAEIMIALSINAYFGAHAMLQVALPRYGTAAILAAIFLISSLACTTLDRGARITWRCRYSRPQAMACRKTVGNRHH